MARQIRPYAKGIESIIVSIIYGRPVPQLTAGLFVNRDALLWWVGGKVREPAAGGYNRIELSAEERFWIREGPALEYRDPVVFQCTKTWGIVRGWLILDKEEKVLVCEKFKEGPFRVRKGDEVEIRVRLKL